MRWTIGFIFFTLILCISLAWKDNAAARPPVKLSFIDQLKTSTTAQVDLGEIFTEKYPEGLPMGFLVTGIIKDSDPNLIFSEDIIIYLRADGLLGWKFGDISEDYDKRLNK